MPQFDLVSLTAQIFALILSFSSMYYFNIMRPIPIFVESIKFRRKLAGLDNEKVENTNVMNITGYFSK